MKKYFLFFILLISSSLMAQNPEPLYVVDGVITTDISAISPEKIQSMYVYKNNAAMNIYGEMGKNGVVLIVTKQGLREEQIRSIAIDEHDKAWYETQAYLWQQKLEASAQDEEAWLNYFKAIRYSEMANNSNDRTRSKEVVEAMRQAIPNTYTYYVCMAVLSHDTDLGDTTDYGRLAIEKMPKHVGEGEIYSHLSYLWMMGVPDDSTSVYYHKWQQLLQQQYQEQAYPERVLRYIYNQFQGMNKDGLYFANGDMALFPAKLIQETMQVHQDKQVIVISFLMLDEYREALFNKLGIAPFQPTKDYNLTDQREYHAYYAELIRYIIHATGRDAYFFPNSGQWPDVNAVLADNLYNEGLLLHYSEHPYDNIEVTRRNVETRYHLDYLTEPNFRAQEWWSGTLRMQMNYVVLLSHMVKFYDEEGNKKKASWLSNILRMSVMTTPVDDATKFTYLKILEKAEK